jgi:hypothetical protein
MRRGQGKPYFNQGENRMASNNPREQNLYSEFQTALSQSEANHRDPTEIFVHYVSRYEDNKFSIRNLIKIGLNDRYKARLESSTHKKLTQELVKLILDDICKERNQNSNPSLFFKFIGVNNLANLSSVEADRVLKVCLAKLNAYISCDKNIFYLLLKLLKTHPSVISNEQKIAVMTRLLDSFLLYFVEFENDKLRKDNEVIKNFISHFKIFNFLEEIRYFEGLSAIVQDSVIQIALCTLFIGTSMEGHIFSSVKTLIRSIREHLKPRTNTFYFDKNQGSMAKRFINSPRKIRKH